MRWHTEECRHEAQVYREECLASCEQKWRAFIAWVRQDVQDSDWNASVDSVINLLDIEEEVSSNDNRA